MKRQKALLIAPNIAKRPELVRQPSTPRSLKQTRTVVWMGKDMKLIAVVGRAGVYEAMALALFAGMAVLLSMRSCRSSQIDDDRPRYFSMLPCDQGANLLWWGRVTAAGRDFPRPPPCIILLVRPRTAGLLFAGLTALGRLWSFHW